MRVDRGPDPAERPVFRPDVETEVADELAFHVEMRTRELEAKGWPRDAAREEVLRRFGDLDRVRRECATLGRDRNRRVSVKGVLFDLLRDVRHGVRQLRRSPGFSAAAVLTLALGVGGTTAIFSVVNAVVLRPFAFAEPERVVLVAETWRGNVGDVSAGNFVDWEEASTSFDRMAAARWSNFNLSTEDAPERVLGLQVTQGYFDVFGVSPLHGRVFFPEEDAPGRETVVILSQSLWEERFDADPGIVDRDVRLNGVPYTVVGVMPDGFNPFASTERLWVPIAFTAERRRMHDEHYLTVVAKLRRGVTIETAHAEMERIAADLSERYPQDNAERSASVLPFAEVIVTGDLRARLFVLLGAVGLVLLIACGNVANLFLARGTSRARELGIRAAIGAGRTRISTQLLTESLVLSLAAGALGVLVAFIGVRALLAAAPPIVPRLETVSVNGAALAFALVVAILSGVLAGLVPALRMARGNLVAALRDGSRGTVGSMRDRLRGAFVAAEVALAFTLLIGAGLLVRTAILLGQEDPGFRPAGVLSGRVTLPPAAYGEGEVARQAFARLADQLAAMPGVAAAALSSQVPAGPGGGSNGLVPEGWPMNAESSINSRLRIVTPGYFDALGIELLRGRDFTRADIAGNPRLMIVSRSLANTAWPDEDPIGKRILCCEGAPDDPRWKTVIGVVEDVRWNGPGQAFGPEFYLPLAQAPAVAFGWIQNTMTLVARSTTGDVAVLANAMRRAASETVPDVPVFDVRTLEARLRATFATGRFNAQLLAVLGIVGLLLAVIGIYGVVAYNAGRRSHEIGLRMALGASAADVVVLVTRQGLRPVAIGLLLGLTAAFAATRVLQNTLFGVTPTDPATFTTVTFALAVVAAMAAALPAVRAVRIDPGRVLARE